MVVKGPSRARGPGTDSKGSERPGASKPGTVEGGGLIVVATPIGNAADITLRALDILESADVIACEDTRVTAKLLAIHGIRSSLFAYHEHNARRVRPRLIRRLEDGDTVALVSDAGTPLVSDPGYRLVGACIERGIPVTAVPGSSAVLAALVVSGLPTDRFFFVGYLPPRPAARRRALADLAPIPATVIILESPRRLAAALADMAETLGPRPACVAREMTKAFEEVRRGSLDELAAAFGRSGAPKGEVTVVVGPPVEEAGPSVEALDALLTEALAEASVRDAAGRVARATGVARRRVYARALELKRRRR